MPGKDADYHIFDVVLPDEKYIVYLFLLLRRVLLLGGGSHISKEEWEMIWCFQD